MWTIRHSHCRGGFELEKTTFNSNYSADKKALEKGWLFPESKQADGEALVERLNNAIKGVAL